MSNIQISLSKFSFAKGETITFQGSWDKAALYSLAGIDIYDCGVVGAGIVYASSLPIEFAEEKFEIKVDTSNLNVDLLELKKIAFHSPRDGQNPPADSSVAFLGGRDYQRIIFEVIPAGQKPRSREEIEAEAEARERAVETEFLEGFDISTDPATASVYSLVVFLSGVMMSQRMRFSKWEVVPFRGLDSKDVLDLVNEFLATRTKTNFRFQYSKEHSQRVRNENPTLAAKFYRVVANSLEDALSHCYQECQNLSDILSLRQGGAARILGAVIIDNNKESSKYVPYIIPYRGNLLFGGEGPQFINKVLSQLRTTPLLKYLLTSYREAVAETNSDFEYLRYWQVLETLAESKNYNPTDDLMDFSGKPISEKGKPLKIKRAKPIVYNLIKSHLQLNNYAEPRHSLQTSGPVSYDLWQFVISWHAMRNATAHYGGFKYSDPLQQLKLNDYEICKKAHEDRLNSQFDFILMELKSVTRLVVHFEINMMP